MGRVSKTKREERLRSSGLPQLTVLEIRDKNTVYKMQNARLTTFGVSPAFFLSRHGPSFGPSEISNDLAGLAEAGFGGYQAEMFTAESMRFWKEESASALAGKTRDLGLTCDTFVAHFLGHRFSTRNALYATKEGTEELERVLDVACALVDRPLIVIPMLPFQPDSVGSLEPFSGLWEALVDKVAAFAQLTRTRQARLGVEMVPGGLVSNSCWFERLRLELEPADLGCLLDTGNLWASGEVVSHAAERLGGHCAATHLCDVRERGSHKLEPGRGILDWPGILWALREGYSGRLDIEIKCSRKNAMRRYAEALRYLRGITARITMDQRSSA